MKKLIVNADDFGRSKGMNKGTIEAFRKGIVTSTTLMVDGKAADEAAKLAKRHPKLGLGLHFVLVDADDLISLEAQKALVFFQIERAKKEFFRQVDEFKKLFGKLPDHIDGHQHIHKLPSFFPFIKDFCQENNLPFRGMKGIKFIRSFYGMNNLTKRPKLDKISVKYLIQVLKNLEDGATELMCHPGYAYDLDDSSYAFHREVELKTLTDSRIKDFIKKEGIKLINFSQI